MTSNIKEPKLGKIPPIRNPKQAKDFVKHLEIISLLNGLKLHNNQDFKEACVIYRIGLN